MADPAPQDHKAAMQAIKTGTPEEYSAAIQAIKAAKTADPAEAPEAEHEAAEAQAGGEAAPKKKRAPRKATKAQAEAATKGAEGGEAAPAKKRAPRKAAGKGRAAKKHAEGVVAAAAQDDAVRSALGTVSAKVFVEEDAPDVGALVAGQPEVHYFKRTVRKRKRPDPAATLARYRERIVAERTPEEWASLADAWLSDYGLYSGEAAPTHHAHALVQLAAERGVTVKGVCAENMKGGAWVQQQLPDGTDRAAAKVVYVGGQNRFTEHERSPWAVSPADTVLV